MNQVTTHYFIHLCYRFFIASSLAWFGFLAAHGQSFPFNLPDLPAGKTITITYIVEINDPLNPLSTTWITQQDTVTADGGIMVLSDDPDLGGANDPTQTAVIGFTSSVHGFAYHDIDGDGVYVMGTDLPLDSVEFILSGNDALGNPIGPLMDTTDMTGKFWFDDIPASDAAGYTISGSTPNGYMATSSTVFMDTVGGGEEVVAFAGDGMIMMGQTERVDAGLQFGFAIPGSIHGFKFEDVDADGVYDPMVDQPMSGIIFTLTGTDGTGNMINIMDTTEADGKFWFTGLAPNINGVGMGTGYTVTETLPSGLFSTTPTSVDLDLQSGEELVAFAGDAMLSMGALQTEIVLGTTLMFGNTVPGSIHAFKYEDIDGDGTYSAMIDLPLPGVSFTLTGTDGMGNPVGPFPTTSDMNGQLWFIALVPGTYTLTETVPIGFVATTPTSYTTTINSREEYVAFAGDAMLPPMDPRVEVVVGSPLMFGNTVPGSIHGFKFADANTNGFYDFISEVGQSNVRFDLTGIDGMGNPVGPISISSNVDGEFWFTNLMPGSYTISEVLDPGQIATTPTTYNAIVQSRQELVWAPGAAMLGPMDPRVEVNIGTPLVFGNATASSIHGFVFEDIDSNGMYDLGLDFPFPGVQIDLQGTDGMGNMVAENTMTDGNGEFWFSNLLGGIGSDYTASVVLPPGAVPSTNLNYMISPLPVGEEHVAFAGQAMLEPGQVEVVVPGLTFGINNPGLAACNPNCRDVNASLDVDGTIQLALTDILTNPFTCASGVEIIIENAFGGILFGPELITLADDIVLQACSYLGQELKIIAKAQGGTCWSRLTLKQGNGPIFEPGRVKNVYCYNPLVDSGHIDGTIPQALVPCDGMVTGQFVADWIAVFDCDLSNYPENDTVKIILREYEAFDKDGRRASVMDTIIVFNLPPIIAGFSGENTYCAALDTTYCGKGFAGPFMVVPELCPDDDPYLCDTLFFLRYDEELGTWVTNDFDSKCGIGLHLDIIPFGNDGCAVTTKFILEIKQNCYGREMGQICGIQPRSLDNAFEYVPAGAPTLGEPLYLRCEFWLTDLDTVRPEAACKFDDIPSENIIWSSLDAAVPGSNLHCYPTHGQPVILVPAGTHDCSAEILLPPLCVKDDWSGIKQVKASIIGIGTWILEATGDTCSALQYGFFGTEEIDGYCYASNVHVEIPKTEEPIEILYEIYDSCHNVAYRHCYLLVKDQVKPVPIADKGITVSLSDKKVWVDAEAFDEGSWDNCGINLLLARRSDWSTACIDICDSIEWCCISGHSDTIYTAWLEPDKEIDEIEAHYAKVLDWLCTDEVPCGDLIYNAWQYDLMRIATQRCADPSYPVDDQTFRKLFEECYLNSLFIQILNKESTDEVEFNPDLGDFADKLKWIDPHPDFGCETLDDFDVTFLQQFVSPEFDAGVSELIDVYQQIGGGWSDAVPFSCEDACGPVTVEILVMDYWCNWGTAWTTVWVEDKTPVDVVKDVVDLDGEDAISCKSYRDKRYSYPGEIHPVSLEYIVERGKEGDAVALDQLDLILGGYCKAWVDPYGNYVDAEGVAIDCEIPFADSQCYCKDTMSQVRVYDEHLGYIWKDSTYRVCYYGETERQLQKGLVVVNCSENVYCEQEVWCEIDHCGEGYIFRKFKIWQGCPPSFYSDPSVPDSLKHSIDTIYRHQKIRVGNSCPLDKGMFDVPGDLEVFTCAINYDEDGNVGGELGPENTGYATYKFDDDCRLVGIAHDDKLFKIVGGDAACYKLIRTWYFADWCSGQPETDEWWIDSDFPVLSCEQKIIVRDTALPVCMIDGPVDNAGMIEISGCTYDFSATVDLSDPCGVVAYSWELKDLKDDGSQVVVDRGEGALAGDLSQTVSASSSELPAGSYKLVFTAVDACNNEGLCDYYFDIVNAKKPAAVCMTMITARLNPMDLDQDGEPDTAMAIIWAEEFNSSSEVACQDQYLEFRLDRLDQVGDDTFDDDTSYIEVGCDDFGTHLVRLWVISQPSGTADFCDVILAVQSDFTGCIDNAAGEKGSISVIEDMRITQKRPQRDGEQTISIPGDLNGSDWNSSFYLDQNRPNPFREETSIGFYLPEDTEAILTIYDVKGKLLRSWHGDFAKGYNSIKVRYQDLRTSGLLYYQLDTHQFTATRKMVIIR